VIFILVVASLVGTASDEPEFDFAYSDGLYATVTLPMRLDKPDIDDHSIKLSIPGFQKEMKVRVLWQTEGENRVKRAPLAVPLPGIAGRDKDELARMWQSLLFKSGCHVMTADSSFSHDFNESSGLGVSGHVVAEAEAVAKVIEAFLNTPEARDKVSEVRLLGASYGGNVALYLAKLSNEGKLRFPLGVVVALSPPVSVRDTARILDNFYAQDFASYSYNPEKLVKLKNEPLVSPAARVPFRPRLMRAGIGYVFHSELQRIVKQSDRMYHLGLLEKYEHTGDKRGEARNWTFTQFIEEMSYPYWRKRDAVQSVDAFWSMGALETLLPVVGDNVFVYVSQDDPLNDPAQVAALQARFQPPLFNVLPGGGHLGFAQSPWMRKIVLNKFGCSPAQAHALQPAPIAAECRR
jgi:predicted alpha/beta-fold hydrolase